MRKVFLILCALSLATGCSRNEKDDSASNQIEDPATRKNYEYLKKEYGVWSGTMSLTAMISSPQGYGLKYGAALLPLLTGVRQ